MHRLYDIRSLVSLKLPVDYYRLCFHIILYFKDNVKPLYGNIFSSNRLTIKAHTHRLIFRGFAAESGVELAKSIPESADSTTDFVIIGQLPVLNMFTISTPIKLADSSQPTIAIGRLQIGLMHMGLKIETQLCMCPCQKIPSPWF